MKNCIEHKERDANGQNRKPSLWKSFFNLNGMLRRITIVTFIAGLAAMTSWAGLSAGGEGENTGSFTANSNLTAENSSPDLSQKSVDQLKGMINSSRALREKLLKDPYRPGYHFIVSEGICMPFDPNGALFWKGRYHLFYIFQNEKGHSWGHASSTDLLHWRHHPVALQPDEDDEVIFSGGVFIDKNGVPTITYWGLGEGRGICLATSTDDMLDQWTKSPHNPVILQTGHGLAVTDDGTVYGAADPSAIWIKDGRYYMLTGNLLVLREFGQKKNMPEHLGDTLYLFVSDDMINWEYLHPFYKSSRRWTRETEDNMCPDFFPLGDRHMLLFISHNLGCQYYLGRYENDFFYPENHGRMTWTDNAFFAPESIVDEEGRRIMWAWIFDGRSKESQEASGWSGTMSLPRVLRLAGDGTLEMNVPKEMETLRYNPKEMKDLIIPADSELPLKNIRGNSLELLIEMMPGSAAQFGVKVCCSPDGEEQTVVICDTDEKSLKIDTEKSSLGEGKKSVESAPFELKKGEPLQLRVFVDKSVVEVFANNRQGVMRRIYPTNSESKNVLLFAKGGEVKVKVVKAI